MGWSDDYLEHHGILGQKWGVRRFQNPDGSLTAKGQKRYNQVQEAKAEYKKAKKDVMYYRNYGWYDAESENRFNKASGMYDLRKKQLSDEKAKQKMAGRTKIGKREQALIEKYKEKGMSQEEAEVAAYKRAKLEKTLIAAGAVTVAVATAYGAKKYHDYISDEILEVGKVKMKRIAQSDSTDLHDTFYTAFNKGDVNKYVGMYGTQIKNAGAKNVYQKSIDLKENIKIASDKNSKETFGEVLRNTSSQNRDQLVKNMESNRNEWLAIGGLKQAVTISKGMNDIKKGKYNTKAAYDAFNIDWRGNPSNVKNEFVSALKSKGYSGVKDRNDASYSGYNASSARIIFDNSKVKVSDVRKVSDSEIESANFKELMKNSAKQIAKVSAIAAGASMTYNKAARSKENNKAIADYKKEHPNTKLSNDEILENYYGGDKK